MKFLNGILVILALVAPVPALAQSGIPLLEGELFEWDSSHDQSVFKHDDINMRLQLDYTDDSQDWAEAAALFVNEGTDEVFSLRSEAGLSGFGELGLFPIDRKGGLSVVFGAYTGGAHCCMNLLSAHMTEDGAQIANLGYHDGGFITPRDVDEDGLYEFVLSDGRFNYTFTSYAGSFPPVKVLVTDGGELRDVTTDFRSLIKSDMVAQSRMCGGEGGWNASACAALAANAARIGRYDEIRAKIVEHLETGSFDAGWEDFSFCLDDQCDDSRDFTYFPEALDYALKLWGYI